MHIEVTVPTKYTGAILGDLFEAIPDREPGFVAGRPGRDFRPGSPRGDDAAHAAQLGSITQGQGAYTMDFSHYDTVPANVQQQIVGKAKLAKDEDE